MDVEKSQRVPLSVLFGIVRLFFSLNPLAIGSRAHSIGNRVSLPPNLNDPKVVVLYLESLARRTVGRLHGFDTYDARSGATDCYVNPHQVIVLTINLSKVLTDQPK